MEPSRITNFAERLYRGTAAISRETHRRENLSNVIVYGALLLAASGLFFDLLSLEANRWSHSRPSVELTNENWKLLVNPPTANCELAGKVSSACPASPANPALWERGESRFDSSGQRKRKAKKEFWIGATFTPQMLARARELRANQLVVGWVFSDYDLFVNGQWLQHGLLGERTASVVPLPLADLEGALKVALLVHPDSEGAAPDYLASPWTEGLATDAEARAYRSANSFWHSAKPLGLFLLNFLFSVMFFLFWQMQKRKQEYFYFALYGMVSAMIQIKFMDMFRGSMDVNATQAFDIFLYVAEGGFGFLTALSFSRGPQSIFRHAVPFFLLAPWVVIVLPLAPGTRAQTIAILFKWIVPAMYLAGAAVCAVQAWHLTANVKKSALGSRVRQLCLFSLGMAVIAVISYAETHGYVSLTVQAFTSRFTHFSVVLLLAVIATTEYRRERQLLERSPVSKYHRRNVLPQSISGALLCVDIKDSERLFSESAETGDSGRFVQTCLSHLWSAVLAESGTVLSSEGDGLHAFFDAEDCASPAESALRAADRMRRRLKDLSRQLESQGLHFGGEIRFRGGVSVGEIKPVWQRADRQQVAGWAEAGTGHAFVESARLMELERQAVASGSAVVVTAETSLALKQSVELRGKWIAEGMRLKGKHGKTYLVSVYAAGTSTAASDHVAAA